MTTRRRARSEALLADLQTVLREIRQTQAPASLEVSPGGIDLSALLESLHSLKEQCAACSILYAQAAELLGRLEALWEHGRLAT